MFPANQEFGSLSSGIAGYLESLHPFGNITDLRQCLFAVGTTQSKKRRGNLPIPFGPRLSPLVGIGGSNNTTRPILPSSGSAPNTIPTTTTPVHLSITPSPPPQEATATVFKVSVALLTARGEKPPITIPRPPPEPPVIIPLSPEPPGDPPSPAKPIPGPGPAITNPVVQPPDQHTKPTSPVIAPERLARIQAVGDAIASALGFTPADKSAQPGDGNSQELAPASAPQVADIGGSPYTIAPVAPSNVGGTPNGNSGGQGLVPGSEPAIIGGQTIPIGQAATIGGQIFSNGAQGLVVGGGQTLQPGQVATIGDQVVTAPAGSDGASAPGVVVGGQTIEPGQIATINGQVVSVPNGGGNLIVGGSTIAVNNLLPSATTPPILTFGGSTITANPSNEFVVAPGMTASAGGPAVIVGGTTISITSGGSIALINGQTQSLAAKPTAAPVLTIGGQAVTASISGSSTAFVLAPDQTLTPGGALTISGTTLSLPSGGGSAVFVNGKSSVLGSGQTTVPVLSFGAQTITASVSGSSTAFVFAPGSTLTPGGSLAVSGTTFSWPATGSAIVINGQTSMLGSSIPTPAPVLTVNGHAITASISDGATSFILGSGETLTAGGSLVVSGTTFSLPTTGYGVIIVNGQSSTMGQSGPMTEAPALTIDGHTYPATVSNGNTMYDLGSGTTMTPGGVIILKDGTNVTLASDGSSLLFGTSTSKIDNVPKSTTAATTSSSSSFSSSLLSSETSSSSSSAAATTTNKKGSASSLAVSRLSGMTMGLVAICVAFVSLF